MTNYINHNNYKISYSKWNIEHKSRNTLLFVHASGFHGMIWKQIIQKLPDFNCVSIDLSGHGLSDNPDHDYQWNKFAFELETLIVDLNLNNIFGIGHSLGGYAITHATNNLSDKFEGLILFDPSIFIKNKYDENRNRKKNFIHPISRRRNLWNSSDEMYQNFSTRLPFKLWDKNVLKDTSGFLWIKNDFFFFSKGLLAVAVGAGPMAIDGRIVGNDTGRVLKYKGLNKISGNIAVGIESLISEKRPTFWSCYLNYQFLSSSIRLTSLPDPFARSIRGLEIRLGLSHIF